MAPLAFSWPAVTRLQRPFRRRMLLSDKRYCSFWQMGTMRSFVIHLSRHKVVMLGEVTRESPGSTVVSTLGNLTSSA